MLSHSPTVCRTSSGSSTVSDETAKGIRRRGLYQTVLATLLATVFTHSAPTQAGEGTSGLRPNVEFTTIRDLVPRTRTVIFDVAEDEDLPAVSDIGLSGGQQESESVGLPPRLMPPGPDLPPSPEFQPIPSPEPGVWHEPQMYTVDPYAEEVSLPFLACDDEMSPLERFHYFNQTNGDVGIGHERVMFATMAIEPSQPSNNVRLAYASSFGLQTPDRAEYLWAKIGGSGPKFAETNVDYQDFRFTMEAGQGRFSFITEVPMRVLSSEINGQSSGLGNISLTPKVVLVDGQRWQISQVFRTALATGSAFAGSSNGHLALEPGLLMRYRWSCSTYLHSQFKYWIPLASTANFSGYVGTYGAGISHVWYETDSFAILPILEIMGYSVNGGQTTLPVYAGNTVLPAGKLASASTNFANILPGVRFVLGPEGDLGICEIGISGGFCTSNTGWYQQQVGVELKWSY